MAEPVEETWTATGTRLSSKGKQMQGFINPDDGKTRYWTGTAKYVPGGYYTLRVTHEPDGSVTRYGKPQYTGRYAPQEERVRLEVETERAERKLAHAARERNDKHAGAIDEAVKPLADLAREMRTFEDVDALCASVRARLYDAWGNRK
jgi:hypothetical protein